MSVARKVRHVGSLAVIALLLVSCATETTETSAGAEGMSLLPAELHGMTLAESHSGEEAAEMIGKLHQKGVAPEKSEVGFYGSEDSRMMLYVSRFETPEAAMAQLDSMSTSIGSGSSGFGHHTQFNVGDLRVHSVFGHGQVHYFYADGADLSWLSAPMMMARTTLAMLLGIDAADIPQLGAPPARGSEAESGSES